MFSTIRWWQYTSAAAILGLACSSSSSPSKSADDVSISGSTATGETPDEPSEGAGQGPAASSPGTGPYATGNSSSAAERARSSPSAGDISASERSPVAGRDEASAQLDDPRILAFTSAANQAEVEQGRLARERAKDPRVRDFAAMMVSHHTEALQNQQKLKISPEPGADVLNMQREGKQRLDTLRDKKGAEFDREYMELQVEEHRRLLDKINRELMPAAKDKTVVSYLEEIRPRVESHLAQAQRLQQELSTNSPGGNPALDERSRSKGGSDGSSKTGSQGSQGSSSGSSP